MAISGSTVYAGGSFWTIGGEIHNHVAALDMTSGTITAWNPNINGVVNALAVSNGTVYVGGTFTGVNGLPRNNLLALDAASGTVLNWNPNANNTVNALAVLDGTVYAGGDFTSVGGVNRSRLMAIDATSATVTSWNPGADKTVRGLLVSGGKIYARGDFSIIGGARHTYFAQFDTIPPPEVPTHPGVADIQSDRLTWAWSDDGHDADCFKVWAGPGAGAPVTLCTTTTAATRSWLYSGLTPNTQYAFQVAASNSIGDSDRTNVYTTFTLAAAPAMGDNIVSLVTAGEVRLVGTGLSFTNPAGFGVGTHGGGAFAVSGYRWAWDESATYAFNGDEAVWNAGELSVTPARAGRYYLHLQSVNAAGVATPQTLDAGPFNLVTTNGLKDWQRYQ